MPLVCIKVDLNHYDNFRQFASHSGTRNQEIRLTYIGNPRFFACLNDGRESRRRSVAFILPLLVIQA
jgi:hypothetical protein